MAQAISDLPDPTQSTPATDLDNPDELLSQMAGNEIDRMLSEADVDSPDAAEAAPAAQTPAAAETSAAAETPAAAENPDLADDLDALFSGIQRQTPAAAPAAKTPAATKSAPPTEQPQETQPQKPPQEAPPQEAQPQAVGAEKAALLEAAGFEPQPAAPAAAPDPETVERQAVLEAAGFQSDAATAQPAHLDESRGEENGDESDVAPMPIWLRLLEWINAPLAHCSPRSRQILGGVAIVTMLNALLAILYVLIFRRR